MEHQGTRGQRALQKSLQMRHLCILLLFVLGLSVCSAGYCYRKECSTSWWGKQCRAVKECCQGYCGQNCACSGQCYRTVYYTGTKSCCPNDECPEGRCLKRSYVQEDCKPCTKSRQESFCCC